MLQEAAQKAGLLHAAAIVDNLDQFRIDVDDDEDEKEVVEEDEEDVDDDIEEEYDEEF